MVKVIKICPASIPAETLVLFSRDREGRSNAYDHTPRPTDNGIAKIGWVKKVDAGRTDLIIFRK